MATTERPAQLSSSTDDVGATATGRICATCGLDYDPKKHVSCPACDRRHTSNRRDGDVGQSEPRNDLFSAR